jgi:pimeloyl-ACP methyl ester carboxylesterase
MRPEDIALAPQRAAMASDPQQRYWLFAPASALARGRAAPLWISVHGISRNAGAHMRSLAPWAARLGCMLIAPHFSRTRFPDYQRFGRPGRLGSGGRADTMLLRIVNEVRATLGLAENRFHLLGHSGGAQFVQRFVLAHGEHVASHVLSAAGSYAWPDEGRRFPFGAAPDARFADLAPRLDHLLRSSALVVIGDADDQRDASLRQGRRIDEEQGLTRKERAERYVSLLAHLARARGLPPPARLAILPDCGHAFSDVVARGGLAAVAAAHQFAP